MEQIQTIIPKINTERSYEELLQMKADAYNSRPGKLTGYDCDICKNKGYIAKVVDGAEVLAECKCYKIRDTLYHIHKSGLEEPLRRCTFRSFECPEQWQQELKTAALQFLEKGKGGMFVGGQPGSGKTHLCTAVVGGFIKKGLSARYFVWREDSTALKAVVNDKEYTAALDAYKKTDALYIDDLFKQTDIKDADIRLAFELIDYRLRNNLITIISSERTLKELVAVDEGLGSRIVDMTATQLNISKDKARNYRLKKRS